MTWTLRDQAKQMSSPPLQGRGRGWGLSASIIEDLQARARDMRKNPSELEKRLWRCLSNGQPNGHKFRRQQVIGYCIADFVCPAAKLVIEVDGDTHDETSDRSRDAALAERGYRVLHVTNRDVMDNAEGVIRFIGEALRYTARPHPNPSPEGDGLKEELEGSIE